MPTVISRSRDQRGATTGKHPTSQGGSFRAIIVLVLIVVLASVGAIAYRHADNANKAHVASKSVVFKSASPYGDMDIPATYGTRDLCTKASKAIVKVHFQQVIIRQH